jgi:ribosomal protein S18 acetylase RimI-like enzyme
MTDSTITVQRVERVTQEIVDSFSRLLPMLSSTATELSRAQLEEIVSSQCLLVARDSTKGSIVGSITLVMFRIPTGLRAWIEDVVVDSAVRGGGIGELLTRAAVEFASRAGAKTIDLTSHQSRVAAHRLYEKVGFSIRDTSVYLYAPMPARELKDESYPRGIPT